MVSFGQIFYDTVDIKLDILRTLQVEVLFGTDMQGVGNAKVIPEEFL